VHVKHWAQKYSLEAHLTRVFDSVCHCEVNGHEMHNKTVSAKKFVPISGAGYCETISIINLET